MRALALATLLLSACVVVPARGPGGPPPVLVDRTAPPPPGPRLLSEGEAVNLAMDYARRNGIGVDHVKKAHMDGDARWHVDLRGEKHGGKAKFLIDARTGRILSADLKEKQKDHGHGHGNGHDDEDDD